MPLPWKGSLLLALISPVLADYYIDDTNTTLTYSSGPKAAWAPYAVGAETLELLLPNGTYEDIDAFVCYNHTYRYAACFDTDSCLLTIPFTGSGITVYVNQAGPVGINASITVDGAHSQTNVLNAPPAPAYQIANVSMFDVQQLPTGPHTLSLLINDLFGSYSGMMFDYAYINESLVANSVPATVASSTATAASTATSASTSVPTNSSSGSHSDIGAILGGVIAAAAVVTGIFACLWIRRRRRRRTPEMIDLHASSASPPFYSHGAYDPPFNATGAFDPFTGYNPPAGAIVQRDHTSSHSTELSSFTPLAPNRLGPSEARGIPGSLGNGQDVVIPFTAITSASDPASTRDSKTRSSSQPQTESLSDLRQETSSLLTDEQADFINTLYRNNVPAAAVARVVERMLADQHAGIREWERETRLARATMTTAPPSYDFAAGEE